MSDYELPDLPSDEELGIADMDEDDPKDPHTPPPGSQDPGKTPPPPAEPRHAAAGGFGAQGPAWQGFVTLAVLLATVFFTSSYRSIPSPEPANAPDSVFSSGRALSVLVELARDPRPAGSPEHDRVRQLLVDRLESLGLEPEIQETTRIVELRQRARAVTLRNIVARIPGTESTGALLLTAHYDAVAGSPGAGDDGTGVVAILETLRALQRGEPLRNDLIVLITDAEELGLVGARAFVDEHPWMSDVRLAISVEMRGTSGPSVMFETGRENGWIVQRLAEHDPAPMANSLSMEVYRRLPNDTDFSAFRDAGVQGLNFAAIGDPDHYHQSSDTPENLREATLQHHGVRLLALTRALGNADLTTVTGPDQAYVVLPFLGQVTLPGAWTWIISLGLLLVLLIMTFVASLRGARSRGFLLASILSLVGVGLAAGAGWALVRWVLPLHVGYDAAAMVPAVHVGVPYWVALASLTTGIMLVLFALEDRWVTPLEATMGGLLLPVLVLLAATFMAPAAAINIQGPLAAAILLLAVLALVGSGRGRGTVAWIASVILAIPVLAFLVPVLELVGLALSLRSAPVVAALLAITLQLILPALSSLERPNRWWAPTLALAVALGALGVGWTQHGLAESRPGPSTLVYTLDRSAGSPDGEARWLSLPGPGLEWAQTATGRVFQDSADVTGTWGLPPRAYRAAEAPTAAAEPPLVAVLQDTLSGSERRVRLAIESRIGAELLWLQLPEEVVVTRVWGASGAAGPTDGLVDTPVQTVEHWGRPEGFLEVSLAGDARSTWDLTVVEHHLRPGELLGADRFQRPVEFRPNLPAASDRAVLRTVVGLGAGPGTALGLLPRGIPVRRERDPAVPAGDTGTVSDPGSEAVAPPDTMAPDTLVPDSLAPGTLPQDTLPTDTTPSDTIRPDTIRPDTTRPDTTRPDTTGWSGAPPTPPASSPGAPVAPQLRSRP